MTSDQLGDALARTDVVISSTSAPHTIVHRDQLEHALADRSGERRLVLIDLATPRDIDPAAASLNGIEIYTIDDLRPLVEQTLTQRSSERPAAYAIVRAEVARFPDGSATARRQRRCVLSAPTSSCSRGARHF